MTTASRGIVLQLLVFIVSLCSHTAARINHRSFTTNLRLKGLQEYALEEKLLTRSLKFEREHIAHQPPVKPTHPHAPETGTKGEKALKHLTKEHPLEHNSITPENETENHFKKAKSNKEPVHDLLTPEKVEHEFNKVKNNKEHVHELMAPKTQKSDTIGDSMEQVKKPKRKRGPEMPSTEAQSSTEKGSAQAPTEKKSKGSMDKNLITEKHVDEEIDKQKIHEDKNEAKEPEPDSRERTHTTAFESVESALDVFEAPQEEDLVERSVSLLAFEYNTTSNKIPSELDYMELVRTTENLLKLFYAQTFGSIEEIEYEKMEMHRYSDITPRLIQFEISVYFRDSNNTAIIPSEFQVDAVTVAGLEPGKDYYNLYINHLQNLPFGIFATTTSVRLITDMDTLEKIINEHSQEGVAEGEGGQDPLVQSSGTDLIAPIVFVVVSVLAILAGWSFYRKRRHRMNKDVKRMDGGNRRNNVQKPEDSEDESGTGVISEYKTNLFSGRQVSPNLENPFQSEEKSLQDEFKAAMDTLDDISLGDQSKEEIEARTLKSAIDGSYFARKTVARTQFKQPVLQRSSLAEERPATPIPLEAEPEQCAQTTGHAQIQSILSLGPGRSQPSGPMTEKVERLQVLKPWREHSSTSRALSTQTVESPLRVADSMRKELVPKPVLAQTKPVEQHVSQNTTDGQSMEKSVQLKPLRAIKTAESTSEGSIEKTDSGHSQSGKQQSIQTPEPPLKGPPGRTSDNVGYATFGLEPGRPSLKQSPQTSVRSSPESESASEKVSDVVLKKVAITSGPIKEKTPGFRPLACYWPTAKMASFNSSEPMPKERPPHVQPIWVLNRAESTPEPSIWLTKPFQPRLVHPTDLSPKNGSTTVMPAWASKGFLKPVKQRRQEPNKPPHVQTIKESQKPSQEIFLERVSTLTLNPTKIQFQNKTTSERYESESCFQSGSAVGTPENKIANQNILGQSTEESTEIHEGNGTVEQVGAIKDGLDNMACPVTAKSSEIARETNYASSFTLTAEETAIVAIERTTTRLDDAIDISSNIDEEKEARVLREMAEEGVSDQLIEEAEPVGEEPESAVLSFDKAEALSTDAPGNASRTPVNMNEPTSRKHLADDVAARVVASERDEVVPKAVQEKVPGISAAMYETGTREELIEESGNVDVREDDLTSMSVPCDGSAEYPVYHTVTSGAVDPDKSMIATSEQTQSGDSSKEESDTMKPSWLKQKTPAVVNHEEQVVSKNPSVATNSSAGSSGTTPEWMIKFKQMGFQNPEN